MVQKYTPIGISFPKELIEKIDKERGDVSRSRFIQRILEKKYGISS